MVPEDGDRGARPDGPQPRPASQSEDAYAATVAPTRATPLPAELPRASGPPVATRVGRPSLSKLAGGDDDGGLVLASDATVAASDSALPPQETADSADLPVVSDEHYRLDREIARGGMGKIVAAEDQRLRRPVALKQLLEPAGDALGRFQREALITARLQHPGIVPVYEAGRWPSGEPFFAMKKVDGDPLDKVIASTHTFEDRLALLPRILAAIDAIAYAHSQRVVHRDLKPGNVLVGKFGETVVIDWGLAKDLDASDGNESANRMPTARAKQAAARERSADRSSGGSSTLTVAGAVMGTPAYMPPEQARGEPVDERADVFALGAMLYHALAGVPPYNARTATDVIAAAALGKVVPLREREDGVPADLVAIVERAMQQLPPDRYQNAGELADDLRKFLNGQLVSSHEYTTMQRLARFVRRHRAAVMIAAIAVGTFAIAGTFAVRKIIAQRDEAEAQRMLADTRREAAEKLIDRMLSDVKDRLVAIGRLDLLANLGGQIRDYYAVLTTIPGGMPDGDLDRMAIAIELIGRAERDSGQSDRAMKTWTQARTQLAAAVGDDTSPRTFAKRRMIAHLDYAIGTIHQIRGKAQPAINAYAASVNEYIALRAEAPTDRDTLLGAAETYDRLGDLYRNDGKIDQAFEEYSEAKTARERASAQASSKPSEELLALSTSHLKLGSVYQARGDSATALAEYRASLRLRQTVLEGQPDNVDFQEKVLDVQGTLADLERQTGDDKSAIELYEHAAPTIEALLRRDPANAAWKRQRGNLYADLGFALLESGDFKRGLAELDKAIESQQELVARDPKNSSWQIDLSRSYTRAGDGHLYLGALDTGLAKYQAALDLRQKLVERDPKSSPYRRSVAWSHHKIGNALVQKNDAAHAVEAYLKALALREQLVAESPAQSSYRNELASTQITLGKLLAPRDGHGLELIAAGLEHARALVAGDAINIDWKETLVQGLLAQASATRATARATLTEALAIATAATQKAPQNAQWPAYLAEIHAGLADVAPDARTAAAEWKAVRELLDPLAKAGRLTAVRRPLLDRANAAR